MLTIADLSLNPKATLRLLHERMRTPSGRGQKLASP
jgi:hypothetical protein